MAVVFTVWDYWGPMFLLILVPMALLLLILIPLMRFLLRKTKNAGFALLPVLLVIPLMAALFHFVLPAGDRTDCLFPRENAYTHTTAGTITDIRPADHIFLYFYDSQLHGGVYVTMDGVEYYSMAHPMLAVGTSLHFTYCPEDDLIMAFSPIGEDQVAGLQAPFLQPEPVPEEPVPQIQLVIGSVCTWGSFLWFGFLALFRERFILSHTISLTEQDLQQRGEVVPNPKTTAASAIILLPFILFILGGALSSNDWGLLVLLVPGASFLLFFPRVFACHIRLEGRNIRIRRFFRERVVPLSSLRAVYWSQNRKSFTSRQLVLVFDSWVLYLNQDSHLGLNDLHRRLTALLSITQ